MKKRSTLSKLRFPSPRATVLALALAGALSSCDLFTYKDPFPPEYYADNWIDAIGFDVFDGTDPYTPGDPQTTGSWDFEYRYDNWDNNRYIEFAEVTDAGYTIAGDVATNEGETLPAELPATTPVYRLELVNLIDGGDFNGAASGTWTATSGATYAYDSTGKIGGMGSMKLYAPKDSYIQYVPAIPASMTSPIVDGREYHYSVRILNDKAFSITDANSNSQSPAINTTVATIGGSFQCTATENYFRIRSIGTDSADNVYLDDFRVSRSNRMRLRLQLCPGETKYNMQKGAYRFTVWAHLDPIVPVINPYDIDSFTVTMNAIGAAGNLSSTTATYQASAASSGWVKLTVNSDDDALMFDEKILDQPVLDIVIDFNSAHSGRVLLAAPELRYGRSY